MHLIKRPLRHLLCLLATCVAAGTASAGTLTFEGLSHGSVVSTVGNEGGIAADVNFTLPTGLQSIQGINTSGSGPNLAVAYDSNLGFTGEDPDLQAPWSGGNLPIGTNLGFLAIIQENSTGCGDSICDLPDDEGQRPAQGAGQLILTFDRAMDSIGFDLIDVEGPAEIGVDAGYVATLFMNGTEQVRVGFDQFLDGGAFDRDAVYGDNTINRIAPLTIAELGVGPFDEVRFNFGGSAAIDNISWTEHHTSELPEPPALLLFAAVLVIVPLARRRPR